VGEKSLKVLYPNRGVSAGTQEFPTFSHQSRTAGDDTQVVVHLKNKESDNKE